MANKPTVVPRWAETVAGVPAANIATPTAGESDTGFTNGQSVVSSSKLNWFMQLVYDWILYLRDAVFTVPVGSNGNGITGTGDGNGAGVVGYGGTTGRGGSFVGGSYGVYGATAAGGNAGAAGDGSLNGAPGVAAIGKVGSGRGALNLNNQGGITASPAQLMPGDLFWDGTNLRLCKVAGSSVIVV